MHVCQFGGKFTNYWEKYDICHLHKKNELVYFVFVFGEFSFKACTVVQGKLQLYLVLNVVILPKLLEQTDNVIYFALKCFSTQLIPTRTFSF